MLLSQNWIVLCEIYFCIAMQIYGKNYTADFWVELHADFQIIQLICFHHLNDLKRLINTFHSSITISQLKLWHRLHIDRIAWWNKMWNVTLQCLYCFSFLVSHLSQYLPNQTHSYCLLFVVSSTDHIHTKKYKWFQMITASEVKVKDFQVLWFLL